MRGSRQSGRASGAWRISAAGLLFAAAALAGCQSSVPATSPSLSRSTTVAEGHRPGGLWGRAEDQPSRPIQASATGTTTTTSGGEARPRSGAGGSVPISRAGAGSSSRIHEATEQASGGAIKARAPRDLNPRALAMYAGDTGARVTWAELVARAADADVILLGEVHGQETGQASAAAFFEDLIKRAPKAALALEFFERDQQADVDDYLAGLVEEDAFRKATNRNAENYPEGHRRMLESARLGLRPVIASNAPRRYARLARTAGFLRLKTLTLEQRRLFVVPDELTGGRYRDEFFKMMSDPSGHGGSTTSAPDPAESAVPSGNGAKAEKPILVIPDEKAMGYFRSQNLWDATMAESIIRLVAQGAQPVVQVVGQFHCDYDGGLAQRVKSALPSSRVLTISFADEPTPSGGTLRAQDKGRADVVVYTGDR